jgi:PAS domain S-box-containing protein
MIKIESKALTIMFFGGLGFWLFDTVLDYLVDSRVTLINYLIYPPRGDFYHRSILMIYMLLFSIVISRYTIRLNESEGRYRQLFDHINDAILVQPSMSRQEPAKFTDANQTAFKRLGYSREELLRLSPADIILSEKSQELAVLMQRLENEKHVFFETTLLNKHGGKIPVEIDARIYDRGGEGTILWEAHDIADRQQAEEALRKAHDDLERRVLERTTELAETNIKLLDAEERERRRISVELHDELGQALTLLKFKVNSLKKSFGKSSEVFADDCEALLHYLDATMENVRRISQDLSPTIVEEFGLSFALEYLFEEFREHYDLRWCSIDMDAIDKFFSQQVQVNIYRIFQEILTNALKHANATRLTALIRKQEGQVAFKVEDNGNGFDVVGKLAGDAKPKGSGIAAMHERVRMMGGSFEVISKESSGTVITFNIPVNRGEADEITL